MNDIRFVDTLPSSRRTSSNALADFLREIAHRSGEWAVWREGLAPTTAYVYANRYRKQHTHAEFAARKQPDGSCTIYARVLHV